MKDAYAVLAGAKRMATGLTYPEAWDAAEAFDNKCFREGVAYTPAQIELEREGDAGERAYPGVSRRTL